MGPGQRQLRSTPASRCLNQRTSNAGGQVVATLENKPGQAGSLALYAALATLYGGHITPAAASLGLEWYAEHTADAHAHPGKHPNIDRLVQWAQGSASYEVRLQAAA